MDIMNSAEAMEFLKVPKSSFERWRANGHGPAFIRIGPRRIAYRRGDLEAWLAGRTFKSRADEQARGG